MNSTHTNDAGDRDATSPDQLITALGMQPHPEGGHYVETWRGPAAVAAGRSVATATYYMLQRGER